MTDEEIKDFLETHPEELKFLENHAEEIMSLSKSFAIFSLENTISSLKEWDFPEVYKSCMSQLEINSIFFSEILKKAIEQEAKVTFNDVELLSSVYKFFLDK